MWHNWRAVVLRGQRTLALLAAPLQQELAKLDAGGFDWRNAEAALYCIRCRNRGHSNSLVHRARSVSHLVPHWPDFASLSVCPEMQAVAPAAMTTSAGAW